MRTVMDALFHLRNPENNKYLFVTPLRVYHWLQAHPSASHIAMTFLQVRRTLERGTKRGLFLFRTHATPTRYIEVLYAFNRGMGVSNYDNMAYADPVLNDPAGTYNTPTHQPLKVDDHAKGILDGSGYACATTQVVDVPLSTP